MYELVSKPTFDSLENWLHYFDISSFNGFTFSIACTFYKLYDAHEI